MTQIKARGLPIVDEDGLFEMIRTLSAQVVTQTSPKKKPKSSTKLTTTTTLGEHSIPTSSSQLWNEKYHPTSVKEIIGNPGAIKELTTWLQNFQHDLSEEEKKKKKKKKKQSRSEPVAALISGPPGIGI
jgi:replication factor C subunit 1